MRRKFAVLVVPALSVALLATSAPAWARATGAPPTSEPAPIEPVEGQGQTTALPPDDQASGSEPVVAPAPLPDGTAEVDVVRGHWTRAGDLPLKVMGTSTASPTRVRLTFSTGADVRDRGGVVAVLAERIDGSATPAPLRLSVDTTQLAEQFRGNWIHRVRLESVPACWAHLHPHEDHGKHKGHAYAYGLKRRCPAPTEDPGEELPVPDDAGDGDLVFDGEAGPAEEATAVGPDESETATGGRIPGASAGRWALAPTAATSSGSAYMLSAGTSGSSGSFAATTLAPSTQWQVGEQSGAFSTSYVVRRPRPDAAGGLGAVGGPGLQLAVGRRTDVRDEQPGVLARHGLGVRARLHPAAVRRVRLRRSPELG
jgi:hypothetical protein